MRIPAMVSDELRKLDRRIRLLALRSVVASVDDGLKAQGIRLRVKADDDRDGFERFQNYGFTSVPKKPDDDGEAEAVLLSIGADPSHGIVIAVEDRRYRLVGLGEGEVAIFDDQGQKVVLYRDRIEAESPKIVLNSEEIEVGSGATLREAARKDDTTQVNGTTDNQFVGWIAAVDVFINALTGLTGPLAPVAVAANAYVAAVTPLGGKPTKADGVITSGSGRVKEVD